MHRVYALIYVMSKGGTSTLDGVGTLVREWTFNQNVLPLGNYLSSKLRTVTVMEQT